MPVSTEKTATDATSQTDSDRLFEAWSAYVPKIRAAQARPMRPGQKPGTPLATVVAKWDEEAEDPDDFLREVIDAVIRAAEEDSDGARKRYACFIYGEAKPRVATRPELCAKVIVETSPPAAAPATRESELVKTLTVINGWGSGMSKEYLALAKSVREMLGKITGVVEKLTESAGSSEKYKWKYEGKRHEREVELHAEIERIANERARSDRRYDVVTEIFGKESKLWETLEAITSLIKPSKDGGPTDEEIDAAFAGIDEDFAALVKRVRDETDDTTRSQFVVAIKKRWDGLPKESKQRAVMQLVAKVGQPRALQIFAWLKGLGAVD